MNQCKSIQRLFRAFKKDKFTQQVRKSHDGHHHDPYAMKSAKCFNEGHDTYTDVGYNLPFRIDNPYRLMFTFMWFFASGFWVPFAAYHYERVRNLEKKWWK